MPSLPDEAAIYPYSARTTVPARSLLVLAPHPDDEVFGCGGLIAAMSDAGVPVHVVIVTDGGQGGDAAQRERESRAAALCLSPRLPLRLHFWRLPDRSLGTPEATQALVPRIRSAIVDGAADWVLAPSPYEVHPDHRAVAVAATQAFALQLGDDTAARLAYYEVSHPLLADLLVDISAVLPRKRAAIHCFPSQLATQAYGDQLLALNRFRSYTLGPAVTHAEAYQVLDGRQLRDGVQGVVQADAERMRWRLGLPT